MMERLTRIMFYAAAALVASCLVAPAASQFVQTGFGGGYYGGGCCFCACSEPISSAFVRVHEAVHCLITRSTLVLLLLTAALPFLSLTVLRAQTTPSRRSTPTPRAGCSLVCLCIWRAWIDFQSQSFTSSAERFIARSPYRSHSQVLPLPPEQQCHSRHQRPQDARAVTQHQPGRRRPGWSSRLPDR